MGMMTGMTAGMTMEDEALEELADEIATLSAHIHAATHRLLVLLAEFDRRGGWKPAGHRSCAHWLAWRTGTDVGAAREKVRAARALEALPLTSAAMARGQLSFAKVRALTRVATPANEADLLEMARAGTAANLERLVRAWRFLGAEAEAGREEARHRARAFSVVVDPDGMYVVRGRLEPEVGALLMRAIEAAGDALYRQAPDVEPAQRRADAVGLLAERAMAAGFGDGDAPLSGSRAERYQVVLHVSAETRSDGFALGAELDDGTRVSAETSRRLACDAGLVAIGHAPDGAVLDVGRRTRTVPPAIRRALEARDRGCRFPGCASRFCDAHHVRHWSEGGETKLDNLVLLCRSHHRMVHEGGCRVEMVPISAEWRGGGGCTARPGLEVNFYDPRGVPIPDAPPPLRAGASMESPDPVASLLADNRRRGIEPDWHTTQPCWRHDDDIPAAVLSRALRAVIPADPAAPDDPADPGAAPGAAPDEAAA
ncbi:MAG TPA: DUF222 domain-containing protein [Longimicrobiales bacterium]|nr:DUF222 domain-containing protein [Longimicrobiales bacterium]